MDSISPNPALAFAAPTIARKSLPSSSERRPGPVEDWP
jgi:hypothetical protein